jgi:hypothetical protein
MAETKLNFIKIGYEDSFGSFLCLECAEEREFNGDDNDWLPIFLTETKKDVLYYCDDCWESLL